MAWIIPLDLKTARTPAFYEIKRYHSIAPPSPRILGPIQKVSRSIRSGKLPDRSDLGRYRAGKCCNRKSSCSSNQNCLVCKPKSKSKHILDKHEGRLEISIFEYLSMSRTGVFVKPQSLYFKAKSRHSFELQGRV